MRPKHLVILLVLLALAAASAPTPAHAGGIVSICDQAHLQAALAGGGTVTFSCSGTITLTTEITIATDTTIDGSGQNVTISGNHAVRVFTVPSGITLSLNELTIANGAVPSSEEGGGIFMDGGTLNVNNSTFSDNGAGHGGGIGIRDGTLNVSNSTFSGNSGSGGGISTGPWSYSGGTITVSNSTFSGNTGGILSNAALVVSNSTFAGNSSSGIYNYGNGATLIVSNSTFSDNRAIAGGGIANYEGTVTVSNSTFSSNSATDSGGGIDSRAGALTVSNSTFSGNNATNGGGGAIYNYSATATVSNSTFSGNSASGWGGGILNNPSSAVTVSTSTFSDNRADAGGGGIYNYDGGTVTLQNSIVANSTAGGNCTGTITDGGGNLSYPDTTCPGINSDPVLGPLQNNGGPTQTHALLPGSPAINAGNPTGCTGHQGDPLSTDQRGFPRFERCDSGAYELQPIGFSTKVADHTTVFARDSVGYTITLTNGGPSPISGARVTDTLPASFVYVPGSLTATGGTPNYASGVITWEGQIAAGQEVSVSFAATAGTQPGQIANDAVISGAGETFTRTATVEVWLPTYLPLVLRGAP